MAREAKTRSVAAPPGYKAWLDDMLRPEVACRLFSGYAEALALIAQKREAMRQMNIIGPIGRTAGWSPKGNFKLELEMPYVAALALKAALGEDALRDPRKRRFIASRHPEFVMTIRR